MSAAQLDQASLLPLQDSPNMDRIQSLQNTPQRSQEETKEETKSTGGPDNNSDNTSLSSYLGFVKADEIGAGICTSWFLKCPPIDGNSHFENL